MKTLKLLTMLFAALALLAVPATASAVTVFQAGEYPADVSGAQEGSEEPTFTMEGGIAVKCKATSQTGWMGQAVETLEVTPTYSECTSSGAATTVATEGCVYRLYAGTTAMDISCPEGKTIKIAWGTCEVTIGGQSGVKTIEYTTKEGSPDSTTAKVALKELQYTKTKDGFLCPLVGTGAKSDGALSGNVLFKATNFAGAATAFFVGALTQTTMCKEAKAACGAPYGVGTAVEATNTSEPKFKYTLNGKAETVTCLSSGFEGKTVAPAGGGVDASISNFTFGLCSSTNFVTCSVQAVNLSYRAVFISTNAAAGSGFVEMVAGSKGKHPSIKVTCGGIECTYTAGVLRGDVTGGTPATLSNFTSGSPTMSRTAGDATKCSATLTFEKAFYKFPKPETGGVAKMWLTN